MIVVGLTGGIGSGKTTILQMFEAVGVTTYIADIQAKKLMNNSLELRTKIIDVFGDSAYENGKLNRSYLAQVVFNDAEKLKTLNSLVHPAVRKDFKNFVSKSKGEYVLYESAILLQSGGEELCDYIILVQAPLELRIERVMKRDNSEEVEIRKRMLHQKITKESSSKIDFVIDNIDLESSKDKVKIVHNEILKKIKTFNK